MAQSILIFLLVLHTIISTSTSTTTTATTTAVTAQPSTKNQTPNFIEQQCQETLYFRLCVHSLSEYINSNTNNPTPAEIARIALRVSLVKARIARAYINQVANTLNITTATTTTEGDEYQAVKDCLAQITDGVDQITHSVAEFGRLMSSSSETDRENEFSWHESNVITWLSTASTDALGCMNGFTGNAIRRKTKNIIRAKVLNVAHVNSNALALVNRFVKRHRASLKIIINKP